MFYAKGYYEVSFCGCCSNDEHHFEYEFEGTKEEFFKYLRIQYAKAYTPYVGRNFYVNYDFLGEIIENIGDYNPKDSEDFQNILAEEIESYKIRIEQEAKEKAKIEKQKAKEAEEKRKKQEFNDYLKLKEKYENCK